MKLIKTTLLSGVITLVRLASGFVSLKIIAVIIGPTGVALVGQLANFITMAGTVASGAMNSGVTSLTAKYHGDEIKKNKIWQASIWLSGVLSIIIGLGCILFKNYLAIEFLHSTTYSGIFVAFGCSLLLYVWNQLLLSILNGQGEITKMTIANTASSLISLLASIMLVYQYKIYGALLAITIVPNIIFFISILTVYKSPWFRLTAFFGKLDRDSLRALSGFAIISIISATVNPLQQLIVRNLLIDRISIVFAGNWQGLQQISNAYLLIVYTAFNTYFLPKFASLKDKSHIRSELLSCYKIIIPFVILSIILVYFFKDFIIHLLYSHSFSDMSQLFFWQLIGDFFKTIAWPMGLIFASKGKVMVIGFNDVVFNILMVFLCYILIEYLPIQAAVISFAATYFLWFLWLSILTNKYLDK